MRSKPSRNRELTNSDIAELLAIEAESANRTLQRALRRAGRAAFSWPVEAVELLRQGRALTELAGIGPFLQKLLKRWIADPPAMNPRADIRRNFFTWSETQAILEQHPRWKTGLRGDLQMHTEWSDGSGTIRAMAEAAQGRGYEYIAITDHGKGLKIAGGINEIELEEQAREIAEVNRKLAQKGETFRVLHSIEMNLDTSGAGDLAPDALAKLDIVLGAFHSALRRTDDQTERYLAALRNPNLHILGHPRGRIYNYRLGLKADWRRVFEEAARLGKAVEIDCYPDRQDLSFDLIKLARDAGVMISLGTDSHHPWQLEFIDLGLAAAASAGIPKERIINFMSVGELLAWSGDLNHRKPARGQKETIAGRLGKRA